MSSRVIKFVAGAGKTTWSENYLKNHPNGLYLAFTNSVVDTLKLKGFISKTIDSLFDSFIIPKIYSLIPIISQGSIINIVETKNLSSQMVGIGNIKIKENGKIFNKLSDTGFNIMQKNASIHNLSYKPNLYFIKQIFGRDKLLLTHELASELSHYILMNFGKIVVSFIKNRFSYVIIDEAQDLKGFREEFAKLLYNSNYDLILLGDDWQNVNGGGHWFESLNATEKNLKSFRCPNDNCEWIRKNLKIEIWGNDFKGGIINIKNDDAVSLDDGKRVLLYVQSGGHLKTLIENWKGPKKTIKSAKGSTICQDVVLVGKSMGIKSVYTAITRTTKCAYIGVEKITDK